MSGSAFGPSGWFTRPSGLSTEVPCAHGRPVDHPKAIDRVRPGRVFAGLCRWGWTGRSGSVPTGLCRLGKLGCRVGLVGLWPVEPDWVDSVVPELPGICGGPPINEPGRGANGSWEGSVDPGRAYPTKETTRSGRWKERSRHTNGSIAG